MNRLVQIITDLDRVIHEPGRLILVALLSGAERTDFLYVQRETGMNKGTLSSHLARLEEAGYVEIEKTFRGKTPQTLLRLTPHGRKAFEQYRRGIKRAL
jgi:DNA-binding MarR family transcriptional regulator